MRDDNI